MNEYYEPILTLRKDSAPRASWHGRCIDNFPMRINDHIAHPLRRIGLSLVSCSTLISIGTFLILFAGLSQAAIITAQSPSYVHVSNAVFQAQTGDTVQVPAGTAYWNSGLLVKNKGITLKGASQYVYSTNGVLLNESGADTVIVDEVLPRGTPLIKLDFPLTNGEFCRLSGFHFKGGTTNTGVNYYGTIQVMGSLKTNGIDNSKWRIDHCYFDGLYGRPGIYAFSGLIDNCYFNFKGQSGIIFDGRIPNANERGHWSWASDPAYGTVDEGVYIENCYFTNNFQRGLCDGFAGCRVVVRYSTSDNCFAGNHGTDSTGVYRGGRWLSVYGNTFRSTIFGQSSVNYRSGTGCVFSNTLVGKWPGLVTALNYRERDNSVPWGMANGTNVWDDNYPDLFEAGTHTAGTSSLVLTDTSKSWNPNQWINHSVINMATGIGSSVISNNVNTIWVNNGIFGQQLAFSRGQPYEIRKVKRALDGCGMGKGALLSGGSMSPPTHPKPMGWPNQADDPIYFWGNTGPGSSSVSSGYTTVAGRNFTNSIRQGYVPLTYPHPFSRLDDTDEAVSRPAGFHAVTPN